MPDDKYENLIMSDPWVRIKVNELLEMDSLLRRALLTAVFVPAMFYMAWCGALESVRFGVAASRLMWRGARK